MFHSKWDKKTRVMPVELSRREHGRAMFLRYFERVLRYGNPHSLDEALNILYAQQGEELNEYEEYIRQLLDRQRRSDWFGILQTEYDALGATIERDYDAYLRRHKGT